jgi:hypothetical protein
LTLAYKKRKLSLDDPADMDVGVTSTEKRQRDGSFIALQQHWLIINLADSRELS